MGLSVAMAETPQAAPTELDPETGQQVISIPDVAGPSWWAILHGWAQAIHDAGCPSCGEHAITLAQFMHDLVNVRLGKPLHSPAVAEEWLPVVEEYQRHLTSGGQGSATPTGDEAEHYLGRLAGLVGQRQGVKHMHHTSAAAQQGRGLRGSTWVSAGMGK